MWPADLLDKLVDPVTGAKLQLRGTELSSQDGTRCYRVSGGILNFVVEALPLIESTAKVHLDYQSRFNYRAHYQHDAEYFDYFEAPPVASWADESARLHDQIVKRIPPAPAVVLDMGCGNGWLSSRLLPMEGYRIISCDVSTTNPKRAIEKFPSERHVGLVADAYYLPFKEGSLDAIVAAEIIEHVPDPVGFVASLYRAIKPGGRVIITTPYAQQVPYSMCVHCDRPTPHDAHIHSFHEENVDRLCPQGAVATQAKFNNSNLWKAKLNTLTRLLPAGVYERLDALASSMSGQPLRYLLQFDKPV